MSPRAPLNEKLTEIAASIRRDARTIRLAIETDDKKNAHARLTHLLALADELAAPPPPFII